MNIFFTLFSIFIFFKYRHVHCTIARQFLFCKRIEVILNIFFLIILRDEKSFLIVFFFFCENKNSTEFSYTSVYRVFIRTNVLMSFGLFVRILYKNNSQNMVTKYL